ncbi:putative cytochrome P450 [Aspergillus desertorum]
MSHGVEPLLAIWLQQAHRFRTPFSHEHRIYVALALAASATLAFIAWVRGSHQKLIPGVQIVGGEHPSAIRKNRLRFLHDAKSMLQEGYNKTNGGLYYVPSKLGERLMLPTRYLEELKSAPVNEVDFVATFIEMFEEWTEVNFVDRITQIVARVSSCMFGGPTLSRNKEWVQSSISFATDGFIGAQALKEYPEWLKPIAARFIPAIENIKKHYENAEKAAIPLLVERARTGTVAKALLYWMAEDAKGYEQDLEFLAGILLKVSFAAIHTSAAAPSQLVYDLCAMPEYIEPLRKEISANTGPDGMISRQGFQNMSKLDSIMKESQRFNPLLLITFERVDTKDYALSDGLTIPANTTIGIPTHAISMGPALCPDPGVFQGFRFADLQKKRDAGEKGTSFAYAASHPTSMTFGYGRHACPGRFFASAEIRAIMAYLIMNYDFRFPAGKPDRPPSLPFETQYLPNHEARVMFKRRT